MKRTIACERCDNTITVYRNPVPTVDILITDPRERVVLIKRRFEPLGWALPGGFVDYGEKVEAAAIREAFEETNLRVRLRGLLGVYSDPSRDKRLHTISTVFVATADDLSALRGGDDAAEARFFSFDALPEPIAFDHGLMLRDFLQRFGREFDADG